MSTFLRIYGMQYSRLPCPSLFPRVCSSSCLLSRWSLQTILSSVTPFSSFPQSFLLSGSLPNTWLFTSGGQVLGFQFQHQGWFPLENEYSKAAGYKNNIQKIIAFLYTNNEISERKIKETISFTITIKRIKHLGINPPKWDKRYVCIKL